MDNDIEKLLAERAKTLTTIQSLIEHIHSLVNIIHADKRPEVEQQTTLSSSKDDYLPTEKNVLGDVLLKPPSVYFSK